MDKATVESVMALAFELARIREQHGAQSGMYLSEVRALRTEVKRLAAQAAPIYTDSTPHLHVGESSFEGWYQAHPKACTGDKQLARDAYAAGMGDPLVVAAQPSQAPVVQAVQAGSYSLYQQAADAIDLLLDESIEHRLVKHAANPEIVYGAKQTVLQLRASSGATTQAVRMLTREELNDVALSEQVGWGPGEYVEAVQLALLRVNAGRTIPADGKIGGAA